MSVRSSLDMTATAPDANTTGWSRFLVGQAGRRRREALLAYLFLAPALLIIGIFGIFPLIFAAYQSTLRGLNKVLGTYDGLNNYVRAIDTLAYVLGIWLAAIALVLALRTILPVLQVARERRQSPWIWLIPGLLLAVGAACALFFVIRLLPELLEIPAKMRGQAGGNALFRQLAVEAWLLPKVQLPFWSSVAALGGGWLASQWLINNLYRLRQSGNYLDEFSRSLMLLIFAGGIGWLTWQNVSAAYAEALQSGTSLDIWTQIVTISAGFLLLLVAWWLWDGASERASTVSMWLRLSAAAALMVGAWVLIGELPRVVAAGDESWWRGLAATFWYSIITVPVQLVLALLLASLLFQEIQGKAFFRLLYFIPYVAPFVGTAAVFRILFSGRPNALLNQMLSFVGIGPLQWLGEPTGVFQLLAGNGVSLPSWLVGPSLALLVIMIFGVWTYVGFNTVIFLAGLGSIPPTTYEAAQIDGAGRWQQFRYITLPLLSPTIYFLTLYSVIGTFKAFNHIYVLRTAAALGSTDTASVVIFQAFKRDTRYGYASALAILLLLIIFALTAINNRIASKRVFYG